MQGTNNTPFAPTGLDDLNALLAESAATVKAKDVKTIDDLDLLLAESLTLRDERNAGKGLREKLARATSDAERRELESMVQAWEAKYEWKSEAECLVWHEVKCACGAVSTIHFAGLYFRQAHRVDKHLRRWVKSCDMLGAVEEGKDLERLTYRKVRSVPVCPVCATQQGFPEAVSKAEAGVPWE